jgi:hypothetical protein
MKAKFIPVARFYRVTKSVAKKMVGFRASSYCFNRMIIRKKNGFSPTLRRHKKHGNTLGRCPRPRILRHVARGDWQKTPITQSQAYLFSCGIKGSLRSHPHPFGARPSGCAPHAASGCALDAATASRKASVFTEKIVAIGSGNSNKVARQIVVIAFGRLT